LLQLVDNDTPKEVAFQHSIDSTPTLAAAHAVIAMMKGDGAVQMQMQKQQAH